MSEKNFIDDSGSCTFWGKGWDSPNQRTKRLHPLPACILFYNHTPGKCRREQTRRQSIPDSEKRRRDISFSEINEYKKGKLWGKLVRRFLLVSLAAVFELVTKRSSTCAAWRNKRPYDPTTATSMKTSLKNRLHNHILLLLLFQRAQLLKRREFGLELKRRDRAQVLTEIVEFIALPFPFLSKLKI